MRLPWQRTQRVFAVAFERRDHETQWVVIDGERAGYLYCMWRHYLVCTATRSRVFPTEWKAVRWLADQGAVER